MSTKAYRVLAVPLVALLLVQPEAGRDPADLLGPPSPAMAFASVELRSIVFPVAGTSDYADTYGACRGDECSRSHEGVDIFAPKLTPLIAAADGVIVSERRNATTTAGNKIIIEDAEGWRYAYLHLNNDSPGTDDNVNPQAWIIPGGLRAGDAVSAGDVVGYLGDSGNAETTPPHLHFEIRPPGGGAINPTPSVTAARGRGEVVAAAEVTSTVEERAEWAELIDDWYTVLAGRPPTDAEDAAWGNALGLGLAEEADLVADLALSPPYRMPEGAALRTHLTAFDELPTLAELRSLAASYRQSESAAELAADVVRSVSYRALTANLNGPNAGLIAETADATPTKIELWDTFMVVRAYAAAVNRMPTDAEVIAWTRHLDQGGLMVDIVAGALADELPTDPPRSAGVFGPSALGYEPGVTVRQGPIDITASGDLGDAATFGQNPGGGRSGTDGDGEVDFELTVDEEDDGSDTASLVVRIPLDQLQTDGSGVAELTVELRLNSSDDPDTDPTAEASVDLTFDQPSPTTTTTRPRTTTTRPKRPTTTRPHTTRPPPTRAPTTRAPTTTTATTATTTCSSSTSAPTATTAAPTGSSASTVGATTDGGSGTTSPAATPTATTQAAATQPASTAPVTICTAATAGSTTTAATPASASTTTSTSAATTSTATTTTSTTTSGGTGSSMIGD